MEPVLALGWSGRPLARLHLYGRTASCVVLIGVAIGGCGGAAAPPAVRVSVTAPTDGATVSVRSIEVLGDVSPRDAVVSVSGRRASVVRGGFKLPLRLVRPVMQITIVATARGYVTSTRHLTVHYSAPSPSQRGGASATVVGPSIAVLLRANGLCAARDRKVLALPILTPADSAAHNAAMTSINATFVRRIRPLERTPADRSILAPYVNFVATGAAATARISAASASGNGALAAQLSQREFDTALKLNSEAPGFAIPDCGQAALWRFGSGRS